MFKKQTPSWTQDQMLMLYDLRHTQGRTFSEISSILDKSADAARRRYNRTDWDSFVNNPSTTVVSRPWTHEEMIQLFTYMDADKKDYHFIAEKLNRSSTSVERKIQTTDWSAWKKAWKSEQDDSLDVSDSTVLTEQLVNALLHVCRHDFKRLNKISQEEFCNKINFDIKDMPCAFSDIKKEVESELIRLGFGNPESITFQEGTYLIVGDSHGKFTKDNTFKLLQQVVKHINPNKIIHVGHLIDDDNDISYNWGKFKNLVIIAKQEELALIQASRHNFNFTYDIVRDFVTLGSNPDLLVMNQDLISDYVKTSIKSLDAEIFDERVIVNCHRLEMQSRCSNEGTSSYIASPGCLCDQHIVKTIKQINFADGRIVKEAKPESFVKYRRMKHMNKYWKKGFVVVNVDKEGRHTIVSCLIQETSKGLATSYMDKIITTSGVREPSKKIFINGDLHCTFHDPNILDIQDQVVKDYKPDVFVTIGDNMNYSGLNHHLLDKGIAVEQTVIDESARTHFVMAKMSKWAKKRHALCGNHERFGYDYIAKNPQFDGFVNFEFLCDINSLGYEYTDLKDVLTIGPTNFIHGDLLMFGQTGSKGEKASRTFGSDGNQVFFGHIHAPSIRFDSYSIGLSGQLDQEYNEPTASTWLHGFGLCNQYGGKGFPTTIAIIDNACVLKNKTYTPKDPNSWNVSNYKVKLQYTF